MCQRRDPGDYVVTHYCMAFRCGHGGSQTVRVYDLSGAGARLCSCRYVDLLWAGGSGAPLLMLRKKKVGG